METPSDIQGFRFWGEPDEGDAAVIEINYASGDAAFVAVSSDLLPKLVEQLRSASDAAIAGKLGVAPDVIGARSEPPARRKVTGPQQEIAAYVVEDLAAFADDTACVVLRFKHSHHVTEARMVTDGATIMIAQARARLDLN